MGGVVLDQNNQQVLKIYTTALPEDGKANQAIIDLLSKTWRLRKTQIKIIVGANQKNKIIHIAGEPKYLLEYLEKLF